MDEPKYSDVEEMSDEEFMTLRKAALENRDIEKYGGGFTKDVWRRTYEYRGVKYDIAMVRYLRPDGEIGMNQYGKWFVLEYPEETKDLVDRYRDTLHTWNDEQTLMMMFYEMVDYAKKDIDELLAIRDFREKKFIDMCYEIGMKNGWCSGRYAMEDGDFLAEEDRLNRDSFTVFYDVGELKDAFKRGNWCLGQAFVYHDLCFMNQIDGGDEWLTIKRFDDEAIAFESISMARIISGEDTSGEEFEDLIERLEKASKEQCLNLDY